MATQFKVFAFNVAKQKYLSKNGGIDEVVNDIVKKDAYVSFICKLFNSKKMNGKDIKNMSWKQKKKTQKRKKRK